MQRNRRVRKEVRLSKEGGPVQAAFVGTCAPLCPAPDPQGCAPCWRVLGSARPAGHPSPCLALSWQTMRYAEWGPCDWYTLTGKCVWQNHSTALACANLAYHCIEPAVSLA